MAACPPVHADPSMFVRAVGLLIVTSSHCSSFEPGIVATASILATLIFSIPFRSLYRFDHCGATLSRSTVTPVLRSCLARLSRTLSWIRVLHGLLWPRQREVTFLVFEHATWAHLGLFSFEPQPPSGRHSPLFVQHSLLRSSFRPCRTNTLTTSGKESSFLRHVQFRPDFVRSDDLVCFQGAADRR